MERELTGLAFQRKPIFTYNPQRYGYGGDGYSIWVYEIPKDIVGKLHDYERLSKYPMWSSLSLDGYICVRWQKFPSQFKVEELALAVERALPNWQERIKMKVNSSSTLIHDKEIAINNAIQALVKRTSYFACWYKPTKWENGMVTVGDVFFYIIDLEAKLFYKIASNV